jgi:hypothetical protein
MTASRTVSVLATAGLLLVGCGEDPATTASAPQPTDPREQQARKARALDAVGYDGAAVEQQLRQQITTTDAQQQQLDEARRAAGGQ